MTRSRSILAGLGLFALGAALGPPTLAFGHALAVAFTEHNPAGGPDRPASAESNARAAYLLQAYTPHRPPARHTLFYDVEPVPWDTCGHEDLGPLLLAPTGPGAAPGTQYAAQSRALGSALMVAPQHEQDLIDVDRLTRSTSEFSATLLADCIEGTILRPFCLAQVTALLGGPPRSPPMDLPESRGIRCTFYDGVAARAGLPLPDPR